MAQFDEDRIEEIFHAALDVPESERGAFVVKECADDAECIREVTSLLAAHSAGGMLDDPVVVLSDPLVGTTIDGRYEIERELPHGGMSKAYVARDNRLRERVVVKVLAKDLVENSFARQHFEQEVEALKRLKHDGVVSVRDRGDLPRGSPYTVMEYVEGDTLRSQIPSEGMVLARVASILTQVGTALEYVHQNLVVHRDVKPENIMLRSDRDSVVLIDFGIAKVMDSVVALTTVAGASAGTLAYMSPEQLLGKTVTAESDVYSLAVVAYEMLTGRRPFFPQSHAQMLDLQRKGVRVKPSDLRPGLPKKADGIILRALSFDLKNRYSSAKLFCDELAGAFNESSGPEPSRLWKRLAVVVGVFIVSLLSYGIYWFLTRDQTPPIRQGLISAPTPSPEQSKGFNYWLTVQTREANGYGTPYKSNGDDKFDNDDKFRLNVQPLYSGYLYIFNESPPAQETTSFRMMYPHKGIPDASVGADQTVQLEWNTFRSPAGKNNYWIVWSTTPLSELETARTESLRDTEGGLTGDTLVNVKAYLEKLSKGVDPGVRRYQASQDVRVRQKRDIVITFAQFEHR